MTTVTEKSRLRQDHMSSFEFILNIGKTFWEWLLVYQEIEGSVLTQYLAWNQGQGSGKETGIRNLVEVSKL